LGHYITVTHLKIAGNIHKDYAKNEVLGEITCYLLMKLFENEINIILFIVIVGQMDYRILRNIRI